MKTRAATWRQSTHFTCKGLQREQQRRQFRSYAWHISSGKREVLFHLEFQKLHVPRSRQTSLTLVAWTLSNVRMWLIYNTTPTASIRYQFMPQKSWESCPENSDDEHEINHREDISVTLCLFQAPIKTWHTSYWYIWTVFFRKRIHKTQYSSVIYFTAQNSK